MSLHENEVRAERLVENAGEQVAELVKHLAVNLSDVSKTKPELVTVFAEVILAAVGYNREIAAHISVHLLDYDSFQDAADEVRKQLGIKR